MVSRTLVVQARLPPNPEAPGLARRLLDNARQACGDEMLDDVKLLTSELVSNSLRHSGIEPGKRIELAVYDEGGAVRVEVRDHGPGLKPPPRHIGPGSSAAGSGWGLYLVRRLSARWGSGRGGRVWFEIPKKP